MFDFTKYIGFDGQQIMIVIGALLFIVLTISKLNKTGIGDKMVNKLIVICIISAFTLVFGAFFMDSFWHAVYTGFFAKVPTLLKEQGLFATIAAFYDEGGMTFLGALYGGLIGYVISYWFIFKHERHNLIHYLNIILPGLILAHGLGRIGCFFVGCCTGIEAPAPWGMTFPATEDWTIEPGFPHPANDTVLPTNLYEAIFLIALFFILVFAVKKHQTKIYMVSYGTFRFLLEFLRGDSRGAVPIIKDIPFLSWVSPSQFLSFILLVIGILLFIFEDKLTNYAKKWDRPLKVKSKTN